MYNLDTREEVDMDSFFEALENGEVFLVSRKWTEEEKKELSRDIATCKAMSLQSNGQKEKTVQEPVFATA